MKHRLQGMIAGFLAAVLILGAVAVAAQETLTITRSDMKLFIDGQPFTPTDSSGNVIQPFVHEGTTYLPLSSVARAMGKSVEWDQATNTGYIGGRPGSTARVTPETKSYTGQFLTSGQVDTYDFSLPYDARVTLSFRHEYVNSRLIFWDIQFVDKNSGKLLEFDSVGDVTERDGPHALYVPQGEYFVRVSSRGSGSPRTERYTVTVSYERNNGAFEYEPNDTTDKATKLNLNTPVIGNLWNSDDTDFYQFTIAAASNIAVEFSHEYINSNLYLWDIQVLQSGGNRLTEKRFTGNVMKDSTVTLQLLPGEYFVRVNTRAVGMLSRNEDYTLTVKTQ
ncbi:MAG: copper amine oxidase N-terminal domain-containing protein [Oscillospiraceae bacterium]|nr:copper amine oxidase N-terminal domain-containing protein [Oscillospiraceae bacterium]